MFSMDFQGFEAMQKALQNYERDVQFAIQRVAQIIKGELQGKAKDKAPWTDRTGDARRELFADIDEVAAGIVDIYLSHGVNEPEGKSKSLELGHGGRYAVIMPTIQAALPEIEALLQRTFGA
jgi:hypothetical protein